MTGNTSWMTRCYCRAKRSLIKQRQRATEAHKHPHVVVEANLRTHGVGGSTLDVEAVVIVGTVDQRTQPGWRGHWQRLVSSQPTGSIANAHRIKSPTWALRRHPLRTELEKFFSDSAGPVDWEQKQNTETLKKKPDHGYIPFSLDFNLLRCCHCHD